MIILMMFQRTSKLITNRGVASSENYLAYQSPAANESVLIAGSTPDETFEKMKTERPPHHSQCFQGSMRERTLLTSRARSGQSLHLTSNQHIGKLIRGMPQPRVFRSVASRAHLHEEPLLGASKILKQLGVEGGAEVVRVGHKQILDAIRQQPLKHPSAQQGSVDVAVTGRAPLHVPVDVGCRLHVLVHLK